MTCCLFLLFVPWRRSPPAPPALYLTVRDIKVNMSVYSIVYSIYPYSPPLPLSVTHMGMAIKSHKKPSQFLCCTEKVSCCEQFNEGINKHVCTNAIKHTVHVRVCVQSEKWKIFNNEPMNTLRCATKAMVPPLTSVTITLKVLHHDYDNTYNVHTP